jgi:hypothetical protein
MKSLNRYAGILLTGILALITADLKAQGEKSFMGSWEGMFMNDYRTLIQFECDTAQKISGRILLWDGEQQIQDDELFKISIQENKLSFYIMAKETHYKGELNPGNGELTGIFIFPDDSEHPLTVKKTDSKSHEIHPLE